jgi:hypothetical protein
MESEFPSNSRRPTRPQREEKPKKIEKVVVSDVVRRKKPLGKRLSETLVGGDARGVWGYIAFEVIVPAFKDTFTDAVSQGVERLVFGEARSSSRRTGHRPGGYVNYQSRYSPGGGRRDEPRQQMSRRARANHDFDEIILATRVEAEEVIDRLFDVVSRYETATVADLYEMVGVTGNYTDDKWGWTDLRGASVQRVRNGYLLDLPRPEPLD